MLSDHSSWKVNVIAANRDYAIGSWGDIYITLWRAKAGMEVARHIIRELDRFAATRPSGVGLLTIIREEAETPPTEARKEMAKALCQYNILVSGAVMEKKGFRAAAIRAFIAGLSMLAKNPYPHKVFASVQDCCRWYAGASKEKAEDWNLYPMVIRKALEGFLEKIAKFERISRPVDIGGKQQPFAPRRTQRFDQPGL